MIALTGSSFVTMPTDWPAQVFGFGYSFGSLLDLTADGLLIEQNAEMALQLADRVYVIDHGTVVFEGTPAALRADRQVTTTYLGVGG